jgi:phosphatidylserine decarboxylase
MGLTRYGLREWMTITGVCAAAGGAAAWAEWWWAAGFVALVWITGAGFFRDPWRRIPTGLAPGTMLSPADGKVSKVLTVEAHDATEGPAVVVRIFLSVLNVHLNRAPCGGTVAALKHTPGKYYDARSERSARENESNLMTLTVEGGETIGVRQVSGAIARRIVCPVAIGDALAQGQRYGMIKFGSTTELILPRPDDVEVMVKEGDVVRGGLTVLARLKPKNP